MTELEIKLKRIILDIEEIKGFYNDAGQELIDEILEKLRELDNNPWTYND